MAGGWAERGGEGEIGKVYSQLLGGLTSNATLELWTNLGETKKFTNTRVHSIPMLKRMGY